MIMETGKPPVVARTTWSDMVPRHFPGEHQYAWFVRCGNYTERQCIACGTTFAYKTRGKKLVTCSSPCAERVRLHKSGTTRKGMAGRAG